MRLSPPSFLLQWKAASSPPSGERALTRAYRPALLETTHLASCGHSVPTAWLLGGRVAPRYAPSLAPVTPPDHAPPHFATHRSELNSGNVLLFFLSEIAEFSTLAYNG